MYRSFTAGLTAPVRQQVHEKDHTRAIYGGGKRAGEPVLYFDQGPEVDHFHYFSNKDTAEQIQNVLRLARPQAIPTGFKKISEVVLAKATREITARSYQKRSGVPQPNER